MTDTRSNAELARLARAGYEDERDELIRRDPELRQLWIAFDQAAKQASYRNLDAAQAEGASFLDAFDTQLASEPDPAAAAALEAFDARLDQTAAG